MQRPDETTGATDQRRLHPSVFGLDGRTPSQREFDAAHHLSACPVCGAAGCYEFACCDPGRPE